MTTATAAHTLKANMGCSSICTCGVGDMYVDVSCLWPTHPEAARVAWAALQLDQQSLAAAVGQGKVSSAFKKSVTEEEQHALLIGLLKQKPVSTSSLTVIRS